MDLDTNKEKEGKKITYALSSNFISIQKSSFFLQCKIFKQMDKLLGTSKSDHSGTSRIPPISEPAENTSCAL